MYQIHVFRFNPRSRCNSSSRCWYRAREHVAPAWYTRYAPPGTRGSRLEYVQRLLVSYNSSEANFSLIHPYLRTRVGYVKLSFDVPGPKIRICMYLCTKATSKKERNRRPIDEIAPKKQNKKQQPKYTAHGDGRLQRRRG